MLQPCDQAVMRAGISPAPCRPQSGPWILTATILGSSMAFIDGTVVNVALPALQSSFHASVVGVQWVVESYGLFLSALILVGGALGDSVGRRLIFQLGVGMFAIASAGCGLSTNIAQLIGWRCAQGIGAAFLVPGSLAIISSSFDEQSRGQAIGTWSGFSAITGALGPVLGGWLIEHASWHWAFFINLPMAAAVLAISWWHVPESRSPAAGEVDWLGAAIITVGFGGLVYGLIESSTLGWSHPLVFGSLLVGCASLIAFVFVEARVPSPMVPLSLFKSRSFTGANLFTLLLYSALGIFFFLFPMNLIQVQGYSATAAGAAALPTILLMFFLSRWSGGLIARCGPRTPLIVGPLMAAAGFLLFAVPSVGGSYWTTFFPAFLVLGLAMAIAVAPLTTVVMDSVAQGRAGTASGINNAVARVAGVLAIATLGIVIVKAFGYRLEDTLAGLALAAPVREEIQANLIKLAGIHPPPSVDAATAAVIRAAVARAFVFGFRLIMLICAALAVASAAVALSTISSSRVAASEPA